MIKVALALDKIMILIRGCRCAREDESDVEIALREALANAIVHGSHEDPRKHVHVTCRCVSIAVKDEGQGFDIKIKIEDPTSPENVGERLWPWHLSDESVHG